MKFKSVRLYFNWYCRSSVARVISLAPNACRWDGSVYVYGRMGTRQVAKLTTSDRTAQAGLGNVVSVNANGSVIVATAQIPGTIYVFQRPATDWENGTQAAELRASDGRARKPCSRPEVSRLS